MSTLVGDACAISKIFTFRRFPSAVNDSFYLIYDIVYSAVALLANTQQQRMLGMGASETLSARVRGRGLVKARVAHLVPRKQQEVERAARLLRAHFVPRRQRAPKRGVLHRIMLVGAHAQPGTIPDRETGEVNHYEIWAFVDHAAYRGMNRHWGLARQVVASSLRGRATIALSVFTTSEVGRLRATGNRFLLDRFDAGVVLYDRAQPYTAIDCWDA